MGRCESVAARTQHDGHVGGLLSDRPERLEAIHAGHLHVRHHGLERVLLHQLQGLVSALGDEDLIPLELEVRRASLEDTYMALVRRVETNQSRGGKSDETARKKTEVQA